MADLQESAILLDRLGNSLLTRYVEERRMEDLDYSILVHRVALSFRPPGHADRFMSLNNLANALMTHYEELSKIQDLEDSVSLYRDALILHPPDHRYHSMSLCNLASALRTRYHRLGELKDLEDTISFYQNALSLHPLGHFYHLTTLNDLAIALMTRYKQLGKIEDLEDSISFHRNILSLRPPGSADRAISLNNLANALINCYKQLGKLKDLEDSISFLREALSLYSPGDPYRFSPLNNLADALGICYEQLGKMEDLEESISLHREALGLCLPEHPDYSMSLNNLGIALMRRYIQLGKMEDLEDSISFHRDALSLRPSGHPSRSMSLNNVGSALRTHYAQLGKVEDLEDSILFHREALALCPPGHPDRSLSLSNLANALVTRYEQLGRMVDLEDSISLYSDALCLRPLGHPGHLTALNNLATSLMTRYEKQKKIEDLEYSVSLHRDALSLYPPSHSGRSLSLNNLANALSTHYKEFGKTEYLEESVSLHRDAIRLLPPVHPHRFLYLKNLASGLRTCFEKLGDLEDLQNCISFYRDALTLNPSGHPSRSMSLSDLAIALDLRYRQLGTIEDFQEGFLLFEQAASDVTSDLGDRLRAAVRWAYIARHHHHRSTLSAYTTSLHLLDRSMISRHSVESQQNFLATANITRSLALDAASAAIEEENLELAVEMLEQGRSILWSKVDAYKHPLEQLRQVQGGGEHAGCLEVLNAELEHLVLVSSSASNKENFTGAASLDAQMKRHRILSEEWEDLVGRIRKIEGFSWFLQSPPFKTLQSAAAEGPVILVNISGYRSDAIILLKDSPPVLVNLPEVRLIELCAQRLGSAREITRTLRYLWDIIVSPVVDRLIELGIQQKSRIWWCPTAELCALPLHAAGHRKMNLQDLYTSSYTSTLSSLIRARSNIVQPSTIPKLLVVGQPSETLRLKQVEVEVDIVKKLGPGNSVDVLFGPEANCEAVLDGLKQHSWVHFACHGHLGKNFQPFQASFELHDDPDRRTHHLLLLDIIRARLPNAELAFLSACHSAAGDFLTPDESIHLSAALQFCGFRSVVGTLWEMDDADGPTISEEFYKYMFRNLDKIDFRDSAHALSNAIQAMRKDKVPLERLAMFVHIGA